MITIESVMLVILGFLVAALLVVLLTPAYRRRVGRLTTDAIKRSMPLTEAEIRADKDRLRAEYAILIHRLETKVEEASLAAARQMVEINRRDAAISGLEVEVAQQRTSLEEHENARRVLEQTIMDRLPKVEHRLAEARKLLFQRDREISQLTQTTEKQSRAIDEAQQINTQQTDEIHRLNAALTTRAARNREGLGDPRFDGEVALRSEIEALRAKTREQANLISRLHGLMARAGSAVTATSGGERDGAAATNGAQGATTPEAEIARLRLDLSEAEAVLKVIRESAEAGEVGQETLAAEVRTLKARNEDQASEIVRLKAALNTYEASDKDAQGIKESKLAMKARLTSLEALSTEQATTIQKLRAEVAAGNERLARQAAHFMDEMRRLGAGTLPASGKARRAAKEEAAKRLSDRIKEPRPTPGSAEAPATGDSAAPKAAQRSDRVSGFLKALGGNGRAQTDSGTAASQPSADGQGASAPAAKKEDRRSRLLERITRIDKSPA